MEKKKTAVPAFLGVAAVWIGSHFGPGFATGAFSVRWYVKYGWVGLVTPLLAMFVTGGVMYYMLEYAREHGTPGYRPFARSCYGEKLGGVVAVLYDVCFLMTMMCAGGLAFSGEGKLLRGFLGINYWTTAIVTILVSAALCLYGSKLLAKSSGYMMYAIVGVVLLITVLALTRGDCDVTGAFANSAANAKDSSFLHAILGAMQYGCFQSTIVFNVMSVSDMLKDKREARKAILSGYVITIVLMVCLIFTLFSYTNVFDVCAETLPVMAVLNRLGMKWLQWLYVILMTRADERGGTRARGQRPLRWAVPIHPEQAAASLRHHGHPARHCRLRRGAGLPDHAAAGHLHRRLDGDPRDRHSRLHFRRRQGAQGCVNPDRAKGTID